MHRSSLYDGIRIQLTIVLKRTIKHINYFFNGPTSINKINTINGAYLHISGIYVYAKHNGSGALYVILCK